MLPSSSLFRKHHESNMHYAVGHFVIVLPSSHLPQFLTPDYSNCYCRNANAYWSTDVLPYFTYSSNHCPHGSAGGGHCILPDEQIWDYKLLQSTLSVRGPVLLPFCVSPFATV